MYLPAEMVHEFKGKLREKLNNDRGWHKSPYIYLFLHRYSVVSERCHPRGGSVLLVSHGDTLRAAFSQTSVKRKQGVGLPALCVSMNTHSLAREHACMDASMPP